MTADSDKSVRYKLISVCIATYKREALLEKLLISLTRQSALPDMTVEIIVVDNDKESSAKKVLQKFTDTEKILFRYFIQPEKNISLTRNMCVENSSGDYICFIDDDETASENWIVSLFNTLVKYNADGVFGYVETIFENNIPDQFRKREFYFSQMEATGSESQFYFTTNCIIKTDVIKNEKMIFDPEFGLTGGEDAHLFERIANKGARFVDCKEAITYEFIPQNRASYKYLFNRSLRGGQSFARRKIEQNKNFIFRLFVLIKAFIMIIYSSLLFIPGLFHHQNKIESIQILGASIGKIRSVFGNYKMLY